MALVINNNQSALNAQRQLNNSAGILSTSMERLSSGLRINSAKDDVAGIAIADRMSSQIRGLNQAVRNANDGISLAQTAEGALQESTNILQRMRELAVQSANDTNTGTDRSSLQKEIGQLQQELNRIANTTAFNGKNLLDGTFTAQKFHVGANANQTIAVSAGNAQASSLGAQRVFSASATLVASTGATNSTTGSGALTINGSVGTASANIAAAGSSARNIAATVNNLTSQTGVSARSITQADLKITATGAIVFQLTGQNTTAATISASMGTTSGATDLAGLAAAINDKAGTTGITAQINSTNNGLLLENTDGYDIKIVGGSSASSVGTWSVQGMDQNGNVLAGAATGISSGAATATVGGRVILESGKGFSVSIASGTLAAGTSSLSDVGSVNVTTQTGANDALSVLDKALSFIDDLRADLGAVQNRFGSTINNLQTTSENISEARSRIQDADFAKETGSLSRGQILQQAGIAMLAQANQSQQGVLQLLR